jgi:hypothetical protein
MVAVQWLYKMLAARRGQLRAGLRDQELLAQILGALDDRYYLLNNLHLPGCPVLP